MKIHQTDRISLFGSVFSVLRQFLLDFHCKTVTKPLSYGAWEFPAKSKEVSTPYEVQRLVPLALALVIASCCRSCTSQQNRFSFVVRPNYTQTVSRPSASKPSQSTAANSSYAAQVVSLVNAERARQGLPALTISTTVQQALTRAENCKPAFRTRARAAHPALPR